MCCDECLLTNSNSSGICTHLENCSHAKREVKLREHPIICSFQELIPIVCCKVETVEISDLGLSDTDSFNRHNNTKGRYTLIISDKLTDNKNNRTSIENGFDSLDKYKEGDRCIHKDDTNGTCEYPENCQTIISNNYVIDLLKINTCGNVLEYICCPKKIPKYQKACREIKYNYDLQENFKKLIKCIRIINDGSLTYNSDYQKPLGKYGRNVIYRFFDSSTSTDKMMCDLIQQHFAIMSGTIVESFKGKYAHMVSIGFGESDNISWQCGGSLISNFFVLTAAHCLYSRTGGNATFVRIGYPNMIIRNITNRIPHPKYKPPVKYHDIALLELNESISEPQIHPLCLYDEFFVSVPHLDTIGWGATEFGGPMNEYPMEVDLDLYPFEECNQSYKNMAGTSSLPDGVLKEYHLCAGGRGDGRDSCQGDSGGPLQMSEKNGHRYLLGITSFGKACGIGTSPGIYTRVSAYISWIQDIVWKN